MFHNEICHGGQLQILSNVTHLRISISCFMYVSCFKIYITQILCMHPPYVCWACSVHYNACVKDTPHIHEPRTRLHEAVLHNVPYWNESSCCNCTSSQTEGCVLVGWCTGTKEGSKTGSWRTSFFCPGQPQSLRGTQTCHVSLSLWNIMVRGAQQYTMDHGGQEYFLWAANVE